MGVDSARDRRSSAGFVLQFDIPVGDVEEVPPAFVVLQSDTDLCNGAPFGSFGLSDQLHTGFAGRTIGFMGVAADTGAHDVFP